MNVKHAWQAFRDNSHGHADFAHPRRWTIARREFHQSRNRRQIVVLDTDSSSVQRNLKPANPQAGAVKLPAWLYPSPGHAPLRSNYDANTGMPARSPRAEQWIRWSRITDSSWRRKVTPRDPRWAQPQARSSPAKGRLATVSVIASPARTGGVEFTITYAPKQGTVNRRHFEAAWFDAGSRTALSSRHCDR